MQTMANFFLIAIIFWGIFFLTISPIDGEILTHSSCLKSGTKISLIINVEEGACAKDVTKSLQSGRAVKAGRAGQTAMQTLNPCDPNPCLYGGHCKESDGGLNYYCTDCPHPMGGNNCQDLICSTTCFRVKDTVYYVHYDRNMSWKKTYHKCANDNMTMAMVKDRNTQTLLRRHLLDLYYDKFSVERAYWIGLNRSSARAPWTWVDGTLLDQYDDWIQFSQDSSLCAAIDMYNGNIDSSRCTRTFAFDHFPLCQKIYPFLEEPQEEQKLNPCDPDPCLHGSTCDMTYDRLDYHCCDCPYPMGGKNCDELACDTACFRLNETVYFLYLDQHTSWNEAHDKCAENDMSMVTIKDKMTHHLIRVNLFELKGEGLYHGEDLWIGLTKTFNLYSWTWIDRSVLGPYQEWTDGYPADGQCAKIGHGKPIEFSLSDAECEWTQNNKIYPLCQKTYPFLINI